MGRPNKICKVCKKQFYSWRKAQFLCSRACVNTFCKSSPIGKRSINKTIPNYWQIKIAKGTWVKEHRYLMEKHIGRKLKPKEIVHHKDGNSLNNSLENLELVTNSSEHFSRCHQNGHWRFKKGTKIGEKYWFKKGKPPMNPFPKGHTPWFVKQKTSPLARHKELLAQRIDSNSSVIMDTRSRA